MADPVLTPPFIRPETAPTALLVGPALVYDSPLPWFLGPPQGSRDALLAASIDTPGIARYLGDDRTPPADRLEGQAAALGETPAAADMAPPAPGNQGGGNLNGTAAPFLSVGHAGTAAQRIAVPRAMAGNFTGVV